MTDKAERVKNFQRETVKSLGELLAAAGMDSPRDLRPHHILRRVGDGRVVSLAEQFPEMLPGVLLGKDIPSAIEPFWRAARAERF